MKLSMWHIWQALEEYQPEQSIVDGAPRIAGLYLLSPQTPEVPEGQYACLALQGGGPFLSADDSNGTVVVITNGPDSITLRGITDPSAVVNRLMALMTVFNNWESRLRYASERGGLQEIVDIATEQLNNPIMLFDMESNVLAMSTMYLDETNNPFWNSCRDTRRVPVGYTTQPMTLENGEPASWTREPTLYRMPDGWSIGNFLSVNGEIVAGFALHEADNPILPGDMHLVRLVQSMLADALKPRQDSGGLQRGTQRWLQDILSGVPYEDPLYDTFRLPCESPWRLLIIDDPKHRRGNPMFMQMLLPRLRSMVPDCVAMEYDTFVVVLVSVKDIDLLIDVVNGDGENRYFSVCLSLPFGNLRMLRTRYEQTRFIVERHKGESGVFYGEDHALQYLSALNVNDKQDLVHPLLRSLREQDEKKGRDLYNTLYQYLINERSIQKGAAALHVHKNTYSYRLERIKDLSNLDLDDPLTRLYLMISYVMDGTLEPVEKNR